MSDSPISSSDRHAVPLKLSLQDADHLLAAVEWALNHRCGEPNDVTLDEFIAPGLRRENVEHAARKIESLGELLRRGFSQIACESSIIGYVQPPHSRYTGNCPCGCGAEFVDGEQVMP